MQAQTLVLTCNNTNTVTLNTTAINDAILQASMLLNGLSRNGEDIRPLMLRQAWKQLRRQLAKLTVTGAFDQATFETVQRLVDGNEWACNDDPVVVLMSLLNDATRSIQQGWDTSGTAAEILAWTKKLAYCWNAGYVWSLGRSG